MIFYRLLPFVITIMIEEVQTHESVGVLVYYDAICKIDVKIKKLFLNPVVKDMENVTRAMVATQVSSLDSIFAFAAEFRVDEGH